MRIYNNTDVKTAIFRMFGAIAREKIHYIEKRGKTYEVYIDYPIQGDNLPDGVELSKMGNYSVVIIRTNHLEV